MFMLEDFQMFDITTLNVATTFFIAQIYINVVGAKMKQNVENEEWNYSDID